MFRSPDLAFAEAELGARRANLHLMADLQVAMRRVADGAPTGEFGPISARLAALRGLAFLGES